VVSLGVVSYRSFSQCEADPLVFQTLTTSYAAEICPMAIRGHLTSFVNICWASGLFISACVVRGSVQIESEWGWRLPYMLQWIWPVPLFVICLFAPESKSFRFLGAHSRLHTDDEVNGGYAEWVDRRRPRSPSSELQKAITIPNSF
jgi:hypothetical protein